MILKLRRKFIVIAMVSIFIVLGIIVLSINLINYSDVVNSADQRLAILRDNGGKFPKDDKMKPEDMGELRDRDLPFPNGKRKEKFNFFDRRDGIGPEIPFETRYFTVFMKKDGEISSIDTGYIASIDTETAAEYAREIFKAEKTEGFYEDYRYLKTEKSDKWMLIFLNCSRDLSSFYSFMYVSIGISLAAILLVFIFVFLLSGVAVKPIAQNYDRQKQFITNASHELKTPLAVIKAATEVIELDEGENEWTKSIHNQVERLSELTEKLVFLTKLEEQKEQVVLKEFSLSETLKEAVTPYEAVAAAGNKKLVLKAEENVTAKADKALFLQMFRQLMDNAMKYTKEGGTIEAALSSNGHHWELAIKNSVTDTPKGNYDMLFERFHRSDASRNSKTGGSGIGLSVVWAIAELHKWKVSAECDGEFMTFQVVH